MDKIVARRSVLVLVCAGEAIDRWGLPGRQNVGPSALKSFEVFKVPCVRFGTYLEGRCFSFL